MAQDNKRYRPSRTAVFLKLQNPSLDPPQHSCSKNLLVVLLAARAVKRVENGVQIVTKESWREVKQRYAPSLTALPDAIAPPDTYYIPPFMTSYPPAPRTIKERELQAALWMRAESF